MRVYIDTEFTHLLRPTLISMGLVAQDGRECYVELSDGWSADDCSEFTRATVLPLLVGGDVSMATDAAAKCVHVWLSSLGPDIEIVSDSRIDLEFLGKLM